MHVCSYRTCNVIVLFLEIFFYLGALEGATILHAEFTYYYYPGDITFPCKCTCNVYTFFQILNY